MTLNESYQKTRLLVLSILTLLLMCIGTNKGNAQTAEPLRLSLINRDSNGLVRLQVTGTAVGSYVLQVSEDMASWQGIATNSPLGGTLMFLDTTPPAVSKQFYRVVTEGGLAAPSHVSAAQAGFGNVQITWQDNSADEDGFYITRQFADSGLEDDMFFQDAFSDETSFLDECVAAGRYVYAVRSYKILNEDGDEEESGPATSQIVTVDGPTAPAAPSAVSAVQVAFGKVRITWQDNATDEAGYYVVRVSTDNPFLDDSSEELNPGTTTFLDESVFAGTYSYEVWAFKDGGDCGVVESYTEIPQLITVQGPAAPEPPAAPSNVTVRQIGFNQVRIDWQDNAGNETGYYVARFFADTEELDEDFAGYTDDLPPNATHYVDTDASNDTYYYEVYAFNEAYEELYESDPGTSAQITVSAGQLIPGVPTVSLTSGGNVRVEWTDNHSDETGFIIQRRRLPDGAWVEAARTNANLDASARIIDMEPRLGRSYCYRVAAVKGSAMSPWSGERCIIMPPAVPTLTSPVCGSTSVIRTPTFRWNGVEGAVSNIFEIAADSPQNSVTPRRTAALPGTATSHPTVEALSASRTFYWRIRAVNERTPGVWQETASAWCQFTTRN